MTKNKKLDLYNIQHLIFGPVSHLPSKNPRLNVFLLEGSYDAILKVRYFDYWV